MTGSPPSVGLGPRTWFTPTPRVRVDPVDLPRTSSGRVDLLRLVDAGATTLLESHPDVPGSRRWSYVVVDTVGRLRHDGTRAVLDTPDGSRSVAGDAFEAIDLIGGAIGVTPDGSARAAPCPFVGGLVGAWSYDLARQVERLATHARIDRAQDWLDLVVTSAIVAVDHRDETAWLVRRDPRRRLAGRGAPTSRQVEARVRATPPRRRRPDPTPRPATSTLGPRGHREAVERVLAHVAAGDTFQVNIAQRFTVEWDDDDVALYRALREASPAPHGALHRTTRDETIVSVSPETFLACAGRRVTTRPIKGTRPRRADPRQDAAARAALRASAKDRAENIMVVDMERNDLGRVCVPGSIEATDLLQVEAHPTVWQLVSTITGELARPHGYGALLRAMFPSGSVTGTPKVRAMQLIEELEPVRRGWYCGAVGALGPGIASLSVAIRTAVLDGRRVDYAAGGGIVADSQVDAEYEESLDKAAAFFAATGGRP